MNRFFEYKDYLKEREKADKFFEVTDEEWIQIRYMRDVLYHAFVTTKNLQKKVMSLSDFYGEWILLIHSLEKVHAQNDHLPFAKILLEQLDTRKRILLSTQTMVTSLFMDPRFKQILTEDQKTIATAQIFRINERIQKLKQRCEKQTATEPMPNRLDLLEAYLKSFDLNTQSDEQSANPTNGQSVANFAALNQQMEKYENTKRGAGQTTAIEYWRSTLEFHPDLAEIGLVVQSISPTQVSVECLFSSVAFILSPARTGLTDEHLDDILLIRENMDLHDKINEKELQKYRMPPKN